MTDQSIANDGQNSDQSLCSGFDEHGDTRGISTAFENNMDYHNAFVGHYEAGDIQYNGHQSYDNNNLIYWKETKVSACVDPGVVGSIDSFYSNCKFSFIPLEFSEWMFGAHHTERVREG